MSWNPATGLVYLPAQNSSSYYSKADEFDYRQGVWNTGLGRTRREDRPERPELTGPRTVLLALDPITNAEAWRVVSEGAHGGTMSTGGNLVFPGSGDRLIAHDARTGDELWSATVGQGTATPITYELDGTQYVSIAAGRRVRRVYTFALDGLPLR
jgi:alcohol dehydrogenase (cytochrome c)/quinohemoprotein ethanol dehydrogenase